MKSINKSSNFLKKIGLAVLLASGLSSAQATNNSVLDIIKNDPELQTLLSLVQKAGLADALGPIAQDPEAPADSGLTVFAPTNEAFSRIGSKAVEALLADPIKLLGVLKGHVAGEKLPLAELLRREESPLYKGRVGSGNIWYVRFETRGESYFVENSKVIKSDIKSTDGGILHKINDVILPPDGVPLESVYGTLNSDPNLSTLTAALKRLGFESTLSEPKQPNQYITIFAPTNRAFELLPEGLLGSLSDSELTTVLRNHIGATYLRNIGDVLFTNNPGISTQAGKTLDFGVNFGGDKGGIGFPFIERSLVSKTIQTTNGTIFVIDRVLVPAP